MHECLEFAFHQILAVNGFWPPGLCRFADSASRLKYESRYFLWPQRISNLTVFSGTQREEIVAGVRNRGLISRQPLRRVHQ